MSASTEQGQETMWLVRLGREPARAAPMPREQAERVARALNRVRPRRMHGARWCCTEAVQHEARADKQRRRIEELEDKGANVPGTKVTELR